MNTGIRTARADDRYRLIGNPSEGFLETLLHPDTVTLALPSIVRGAVVFDAERDANDLAPRGITLTGY